MLRARYTTLLLLVVTHLELAHAAVDGAVAGISQKGQITVAYRANAVPFSFTGAEGEPEGYSIDYCKAVIAEITDRVAPQKIDVNYLAVPLDRVVRVVESGSVDLLCSATSDTPERRARVGFSRPIFITEVNVLVKTDSGIGELEELSGHSVVSIAGTTAEALVAGHSSEYGWKPVKSHNEDAAIGQLKLGWAKGYARDGVMLARQISILSQPEQYLRLEGALSTENIAIAVPRDNPELRELVDSVIESLARSGEAQSIYSRWFVEAAPPNGVALGIPMSEGLRSALGL